MPRSSPPFPLSGFGANPRNASSPCRQGAVPSLVLQRKKAIGDGEPRLTLGFATTRSTRPSGYRVFGGGSGEPPSSALHPARSGARPLSACGEAARLPNREIGVAPVPLRRQRPDCAYGCSLGGGDIQDVVGCREDGPIEAGARAAEAGATGSSSGICSGDGEAAATLDS